MNTKGEQIGVRLNADLLARLNKWRQQQPDPPSKADAIRQLLEKALPGIRGSRTKEDLLG
ncbi:MAG: hypothetical protein ABUS48_00870 [Pseudomonadota bacterium]